MNRWTIARAAISAALGAILGVGFVTGQWLLVAACLVGFGHYVVGVLAQAREWESGWESGYRDARIEVFSALAEAIRRGWNVHEWLATEQDRDDARRARS